jgi:4'-phosphopantetheinyl transferase
MKGAAVVPLTVGGAQVDLWHASLSAARDPAHEMCLAPDERARAQRYISATVRQRFITGRAMLRAILAEYLNCEPQRIRLATGPRGKPALGGPWSGDALRFNVAHSHDCLLVGVTRHRAIGVDVEYVHRAIDTDQIAARFFSPAEYAVYQRTPQALQRQAFLNCWTRKEAYIKARGDGLAIALDSFDVSLAPGDPARLLRTDGDDPARWAMTVGVSLPGYVMALVVASGETSRNPCSPDSLSPQDACQRFRDG